MNQDHHPCVIGYQTHIIIWLGLLALTALTIVVAGMHLKGLSIVVALAVAACKCSLVCLFFMHLKYESFFLKTLFLVTILLLASFIGLTYIDIFFREGVMK
ncbi:MAG: cytochrome C oxidase subunit IV family protein [Candidatus Brocadiae bacterium]|nr:cytochrome C oxidase subunit IV family protein [Candidatus Brocadiia bacterium]